MNRIYLVAAFLLLGAVSGFARKKHDTPGTGNPVIPGYFADPTIKKFGDTYYMYATTDGSGAGIRTGPGVDEQGFCKLDADAHELARQPLDMGP